MSESGSSRQVELTPFRMRFGFAVAAAVIGLVVFAIIGTGGYLSSKGGTAGQNDMSAQTVQSLQEELRSKELEIAIQEKRLKELQESPTLAAVPPRPTKEVAPAGEGTHDQELPVENEGPLTALQDAVKSPTSPPGRSKAVDEEIDESPSTFSSAESATRRFAGRGSTETPLVGPGATEGSSAQGPIINFNAQDVTAVVESPSKWKLSFRLVKDHPDTLFSGYVFVFVETVDQRGKSRIVVYPSNTRLAEEDLPADYREGKSITPPFRVNARVALDYGDDRPGTSLSRVSILLYDENGKIVFQRGFARNELKMVGKKGEGLEGARSRAVQKRRAL
jgi:hypothetical protein